jgi:hypothetical protein
VKKGLDSRSVLIYLGAMDINPATPTPTKSKTHGPRSEEVRVQMRQRQEETRIVKAYLAQLSEASHRRRRDNLERYLDLAETKLAGDLQPIDRLTLLQRKHDLEAMLQPVGAEDHTEDFTKVAANYSDRKGIAYRTWREVGVPASVLKAAGIRNNK